MISVSATVKTHPGACRSGKKSMASWSASSGMVRCLHIVQKLVGRLCKVHMPQWSDSAGPLGLKASRPGPGADRGHLCGVPASEWERKTKYYRHPDREVAGTIGKLFRKYF